MPVTNPKRKKVKTYKAHPCGCCGRVLPKGSVVTVWNIWRDGRQHQLHICSECLVPIYDCPDRPSIEFDPIDGGYYLREICERCDGYPLCDKVEYMRSSEVGDIFFGDLHIG